MQKIRNKKGIAEGEMEHVHGPLASRASWNITI